jgi:hypothetical protein
MVARERKQRRGTRDGKEGKMTREELITRIGTDIENDGRSLVPPEEVRAALTCREGVGEGDLLEMLRELVAPFGWGFRVVTASPPHGAGGSICFYPEAKAKE